MVNFSDLKVYKSITGSDSRGGGIDTSKQIISGTPNNLFYNVPKNELVTGDDYYMCAFLKNTSAEDMDNFKLWLSHNDGPSTVLKWGFDPNVLQTGGYRWSPYFIGDGATTFDSTADDPVYDLTEFTVAAWFNTTASGSSMMIVNKGGEGSDTAGQNMNYGISQNSNGTIDAGFEEGDGTNHNVTSPLTYNDGLWHLAVLSYSGSNVRLYIDDMVTPVASLASSAVPETNAHAVVVGRNSRDSSRFWNGLIDEVRIWGNAKSEASRVALLQNDISQNNLVYEKKFGADDGLFQAQIISSKYVAPLNVNWRTVESQPAQSIFGTLKAGTAFPIWLWRLVNANATARIDDNAIFTINFDISSGGTGSGGSGGSGGGTGGNPPTTVTDYKIAISGDWGCEDETDDVLDLIEDEDYDYVVGIGDNSYDGSASCWINRFNTIKSKMNSAYGNHEYSESAGINPYKTFFGHDKTYLTFKFQNILFLVIDTNINCDPGSTQHNFIEDALEDAENDPTIIWKIAVMHHPWFGSDSDHGYNSSEQVEAFHELFQNNGVNFVCVGHNHNWQRSKQVQYNDDDPEDPTVIDSSSPFSRTANGLIHVVTGTGGHDTGSGLYDLDTSPSFNGYQNRSHNGVWEIVSSNSGNTLTCSFVNTSGNKFDTITIS